MAKTPARNHSATAQKRSVNHWVHALAGSLSKGAIRYYSARFGIRLPEMRILKTLADDGNLAARDLVYLTAMDKALVSRVLSGLQATGYVMQVEDSERIRMRAWTLTKAGLEMVTRLSREWTQRWSFMLAEVEEADVAHLKDLLETLFLASEALSEREEPENKAIRRRNRTKSPLKSAVARVAVRANGGTRRV